MLTLSFNHSYSLSLFASFDGNDHWNPIVDHIVHWPIVYTHIWVAMFVPFNAQTKTVFFQWNNTICNLISAGCRDREIYNFRCTQLHEHNQVRYSDLLCTLVKVCAFPILRSISVTEVNICGFFVVLMSLFLWLSFSWFLHTQKAHFTSRFMWITCAFSVNRRMLRLWADKWTVKQVAYLTLTFGGFVKIFQNTAV